MDVTGKKEPMTKEDEGDDVLLTPLRGCQNDLEEDDIEIGKSDAADADATSGATSTKGNTDTTNASLPAEPAQPRGERSILRIFTDIC